MATRQRFYRQKAGVPPAYRINEPISEQEIFAMRAVAEGTADAFQQQLAMRCITVKLSGAYDQEFVIGQPDQTTFRGGRSWVGKTILKFLKADIDILLGAEHEEI